ncbi:MAG: putative DNA binding domain-containing protein [Prevotellaceae bacterium]|jgi:predicted HTH transcriptional regulator|nr:putative DNA binding domain-containing protein [Prevotellaceae bacterium]
MYAEEDIKTRISQGESTTVQFKVRVEDAYKIGTEMVAFSNAQGGLLIVGVDDKTGKIKGLSFEEIQATTKELIVEKENKHVNNYDSGDNNYFGVYDGVNNRKRWSRK